MSKKLYEPGYSAYGGERDGRGWPKFVDAEGRAWIVERVKEVLETYPPTTLRVIERLAWGNAVNGVPECLRKVSLWEARYAVVHRALLEAGAEELWGAGA